MISSDVFSVNIVGEDSGRIFIGDFTVKLSLTRADRFKADQLRREILGSSPDGQEPLPAMQTEAFILGQLSVRIIKAPTWWEESNNGLELEDYNVIITLYDKVLELEEKKRKEIKKESEKALKQLSEQK